MVSGDTGPTHIAAAVGTPIVGIYGPTRPSRNGPWSPRRRHRVARRDLPVSSSAPVQARDACACSTSRSPKWSTRSSAGWPRSARVSDRPARATCADAMRSRALRVALGFVCGALVLCARAADVGDDRRRHGDRGVRRGASHLGRRPSQQVARGDVVGPVSLGARIRSTSDRRSWAPAWRSRARSVVGRGADRASISSIDADGGDQERGGVSAADVRRATTIAIARRGASAPRSRAAVQSRAGDGQPRVSRGRRARRRGVAAGLEGNV